MRHPILFAILLAAIVTRFGAAQATAPFTAALGTLVTAADIDADGDDDLLTNLTPGFVTVVVNQAGTFVPGPSVAIAAGITEILAADLDGNGLVDILTVGAPTFSVVLNQGSTAQRTDYPSPPGGFIPRIVDVDGDADLDLLFDCNVVMQNGGSGTFGAATVPPVVPFLCTLPSGAPAGTPVDLDDDGDLDLVSVAVPTYRLIQWRNENGVLREIDSALPLPTVPTTPVLGNLAAGDFDGDGDQDIWAVDTQITVFGPPPVALCDLYFFRNVGGRLENGVPVSTCTVFQSQGSYAGPLTVVDWNGDGVDDILANRLDIQSGFGTTQIERAVIVGNAGFAISTVLNYQPFLSYRRVIGRFFGGPASGIDLLAIGAPASLIFINAQAQSTPPNRLVKIAGDGQSIVIGRAAMPLTVQVRNAAGSPLAGVGVQFDSQEPGVVLGSAAVITDAQGMASTTVALDDNARGGTVRIRARASGARSASFKMSALGLRADVDLLTPTLVRTQLDMVWDRPGMPMIVAIDVPLPSPGSFSTIYGQVFTSIFTPLPTLILLDGYGLIGPLDPSVLTSPTWTLTTTFNPAPILGMSYVAQFYAIDPARPIVESIIFSNAESLVF